MADLRQEIFCAVLHILRWQGDPQALLAQINALGYGLTLGIQTRIDSRALALAHAAQVGSVDINRKQIGAMVEVQPFGGRGQCAVAGLRASLLSCSTSFNRQPN